jgi:hypothetical protein
VYFAHLGEGLEEVVAPNTRVLERGGGGAVVLGDEGEQEVLGRDVLVLELLRLRAGVFEQRLAPPPDVEVGRRAPHLRLRVERRVDAGLEVLGVDAQLAQQRGDDALRLAEQRRQQMLGRELLVSAALGEGLRVAQRLLGLRRELFGPHGPGHRNHGRAPDKLR